MKYFCDNLKINGDKITAYINQSPSVRFTTAGLSPRRWRTTEYPRVKCPICGVISRTRRLNTRHWEQYHWRHCDKVQRREEGCKVPKCSFKGKNSKLDEHLRNKHTCTQILDAGFDVFKIRRKCMDDHQKLETIKWLQKKKLVTVDGDLPKLSATKAEEKNKGPSKPAQAVKQTTKKHREIIDVDEFAANKDYFKKTFP